MLALPVRDGGTLQILFRGDGAARTLVAVDRVGGAGTPLWRTAYEDHETVGGARVPGTIRFAEQAASFDDGVEIKFKDRTLNAAPPAGAFTLAPPRRRDRRRGRLRSGAEVASSCGRCCCSRW